MMSPTRQSSGGMTGVTGTPESPSRTQSNNERRAAAAIERLRAMRKRAKKLRRRLAVASAGGVGATKKKKNKQQKSWKSRLTHGLKIDCTVSTSMKVELEHVLKTV